MTLEAGTKLGPYEILSPLGAGGMGEVILANDFNLDRKVAIFECSVERLGFFVSVDDQNVHV